MTLTEAAYWTKRFGVVLGGGILLLIFVIMVVFNITRPDPLPEFLKADYGCTLTPDEFKAERLAIPTLQLSAGSESIYTIETATGRLEELPRVASVYEFSNPGPSLNSQQEAKEIAQRLGLNPDLIVLRGGLTYEWTEDLFGQSLSVDVSTLNYTFKTNFDRTDAYPSIGTLPSDIEAQSLARSYLQSSGQLLNDYREEKPSVTYINIEPNGTFSEAQSRVEAELIRVDFFRTTPFLSVRSNLVGADIIKTALEKEYQEYPMTERIIIHEGVKMETYDFDTQVVNIDSQKGNISIYIGPEDKRREETEYGYIYAIDYVAWPIEDEACGTYDLISATEVTTIIENGNASLVYLNEKNGDNVVPYTPKNVTKFAVNNVILGYLDTVEEQKFIQPVYIVTGEASFANGIVGTFYYYIPAVNYEVIQEKVFDLPTVVEEDTGLF